VSYVGRFAPSPTGPLHIGSLVTAVASFVHARQARGEWLVRIEDIDPPREVPGAADRILRTLERFGLEWDRSVAYQSARIEAYRSAVRALLAGGHAFRCNCSRTAIRAANDGDGTRYPGTCRGREVRADAAAVRVRVDGGLETWLDGVQGDVSIDVAGTIGDYVVWRKDGLPAYHLAVVLDDAAQGVTAVVRGVDLLEATGVHLHLQRTLDVEAPRYFHTPVIVNRLGQKLSKQTGAPDIATEPSPVLARRVLEYLGLDVPAELEGAPPTELWRYAIEHWRIEQLAGVRHLPAQP